MQRCIQMQKENKTSVIFHKNNFTLMKFSLSPRKINIISKKEKKKWKKNERS